MEKINDPKKIAQALQELLEKNHDAGEVFKNGLEDTESDLLKNFLLTQAQQRARFTKELEREIDPLTQTPNVARPNLRWWQPPLLQRSQSSQFAQPQDITHRAAYR